MKRTVHHIVIEEIELKAKLPNDSAERALALLVWWAIRKAHKRAERELKSDSSVVTDDKSKSYARRKPKN